MRMLVSFAALVLASCGESRLVPRVGQGPLEYAELIRRADTILIGSITELKVGDRVHTEVAVTPELNDCLLPVRVTVSVENVLRGDVGPGSLNYYYFGAACGSAGPVESPILDTRSVFFLRKQLTRWTAIEDYWMNRIRVRSGSHSHEWLRGKSVEQAISDLLLTPGAGYSPEEFAQSISAGANTSRTLVGERRTRQLLIPLLTYPDVDVSSEACIELERDKGHWSCADSILSASLEKMAAGNFGWLTQRLLFNLGVLKGHAEPALRKRAELRLAMAGYFVRTPGPPTPSLPTRGFR